MTDDEIHTTSSEADRALALYVAASHDLSDFVDMLREDESTDQCLRFLVAMLRAPGGERTDREFNADLLPVVKGELRRRSVGPRAGRGVVP